MIILTMKRIVFSCIAALSASVSYASVTLPDIISDNMVLISMEEHIIFLDGLLLALKSRSRLLGTGRLTQPSQARMDAGMLR